VKIANKFAKARFLATEAALKMFHLFGAIAAQVIGLRNHSYQFGGLRIEAIFGRLCISDMPLQ
jgi:hypothetical protein